MDTEEQTFYILDNLNTIRIWSIQVIDYDIVMVYGQLHGAKQEKVEQVLEGKAGRTLEEQVESRVRSRINKQLDRGYSPNILDARNKPTNALGFIKPMKAKPYVKVYERYVEGSIIQYKYNGHRCLITCHNGKNIAYSANGKIINVPHVTNGLMIEEGDTLDGELYHHGTKLQTISSWIKREQPKTALLKYIIFDIIKPDPFLTRLERLNSLPIDGNSLIAPYYIGKNLLELKKDFLTAVCNGYEGLMIRQGDKGYEDGKRSNQILKVKKGFAGDIPRLEDEFLVVDIHSSKDGWAILECEMPNGIRFRTSAPGDMLTKEYILTHKHKYIGNYINVEYYEDTASGKPFHAVAMFWRNKRDE